MADSRPVGVGGPNELVLEFLPAPRSVGQARRAVGEFCRSGSHSALADDAELLTSELMTNACRHGVGPVTVLALRSLTSVVVTVTDDDVGGQLAVVEQHADREMGRGLLLVGALAGAWGTHAHAGAKSVWFRLP